MFFAHLLLLACVLVVYDILLQVTFDLKVRL